jgi:hypothetical protein
MLSVKYNKPVFSFVQRTTINFNKNHLNNKDKQMLSKITQSKLPKLFDIQLDDIDVYYEGKLITDNDDKIIFIVEHYTVGDIQYTPKYNLNDTVLYCPGHYFKVPLLIKGFNRKNNMYCVKIIDKYPEEMWMKLDYKCGKYILPASIKDVIKARCYDTNT